MLVLPLFRFKTLLTFCLFSMTFCVFAEEQTAPSPQRQQALLHLLKQDCGSCHGMTLKGGLGPALEPEALQDKPTELLIYTILFGRPGTAMPPWQAFLTEQEAHWLTVQLQQGVNYAE